MHFDGGVRVGGRGILRLKVAGHPSSADRVIRAAQMRLGPRLPSLWSALRRIERASDLACCFRPRG